jgi:prephenate dehydratase
MTTYAYLGPAGTFTEAALRQITNESDVLVPYSNVTAALDAVRNGKAEKVLVPIENSVEGVVSRTLDELALGTPLVVTAETTLPVTFSLMTLPDRAGDEITKIATHPHAESQCRSYVAKNYPQAEIIEMSSTAAAAKGLANGNYDEAIASDIAAKNYGLKIIASNIGDNAGAVTRFVVAEKPGTMPAPTGNDRT